MPRPSEELRAVRDLVVAVLDHVSVFDDAQQKAASAQVQLDGVVREYDEARQRLESVRAELAQAEADLKTKRHVIHDEAARSLTELNREIAARHEELRRLNQTNRGKQDGT